MHWKALLARVLGESLPYLYVAPNNVKARMGFGLFDLH
jgi:hypothetical protein